MGLHYQVRSISWSPEETASQPRRGSNYVHGSLNWGPLTWLNEVWRTTGWWTERRSSFADAFHTYALEWDEDFM